MYLHKHFDFQNLLREQSMKNNDQAVNGGYLFCISELFFIWSIQIGVFLYAEWKKPIFEKFLLYLK